MLRAVDLTRVYRLGGQEVRALDGVSLDVRQGEYLRVIGASGSGKSTLLNLLAGLDQPTSGRIETPVGDLTCIAPDELARWRSRYVGMVFQSFNLFNHRTALRNIELGLMFGGVPRERRRRTATAAASRLGLRERLQHRPAHLSGGEQQRVAFARALAKQPDLLLADEPTGNLDRVSAAEISGVLREMNRDGVTVILVTHDPELAVDDIHTTLRLSFGRLVGVTNHRRLMRHSRRAPGAA